MMTFKYFQILYRYIFINDEVGKGELYAKTSSAIHLYIGSHFRRNYSA